MSSVIFPQKVSVTQMLKVLFSTEHKYFSNFQYDGSTELSNGNASDVFETFAPIIAERLMKPKTTAPLINIDELKQSIVELLPEYYKDYTEEERTFIFSWVERMYVFSMKSLPVFQTGAVDLYDHLWHKLETAVTLATKFKIDPCEVFTQHYDSFLKAVYTRNQFEDFARNTFKMIDTSEFRDLCRLSFTFIPEDERPTKNQIEELINNHIRKLKISIGTNFADEAYRLYGRR